MKLLALFAIFSFIIIPNCIMGQVPPIQWQKSFGGANIDDAKSIQPTSDGGYIAAGISYSNDGDASGNHGANDFWVVKMSNTGVLQWQKSYGGSGQDRAYSIQQTSDGGYIVAGATTSSDGDVTGWHVGQQYAANSSDIWVIKISSTGVLQWQKCYGGTQIEVAYAIKQTTDGGYIIAGETGSSDGDVTGFHPNTLLLNGQDFWIVKINSTGVLQWQKCFGAVFDEVPYSIQQTTDGGFIVGGLTNSVDAGDVHGAHNTGSGALWSDFWIVKLSSTGNLQWQKCLGGTLEDICHAIIQTSDGGYLAVGSAVSNDGDVTGNKGGPQDCWVVKMDASGNMLWQKCYGGTYPEVGRALQQTADGGYIIGGDAASTNGDVTGNHGASDFWLLKITASGAVQWQKSLGGSQIETAFDMKMTSDGGYIMTGPSASNDGDVTGNHGHPDFWVVKLGPPPCLGKVDISPNAVQICSGTTVTFTSSVTNGGTNPQYQWMVNGIKAGTNSSTFSTSTLQNNDSVVCLVTSNASCLLSPVIISDTIIMSVHSCPSLQSEDTCLSTYFKKYRTGGLNYYIVNFFLMRNNNQISYIKKEEQVSPGISKVSSVLTLSDEKGHFIKSVDVLLNGQLPALNCRKMTDSTFMLIFYWVDNGIICYTFTLVSDNLNIIWSKSIKTYANFEFTDAGIVLYQVVRDQEGNYYFIGSSFGYPPGKPGVLVYKMDKDGNQLWLKAYNFDKGLLSVNSAVVTATALIVVIEGSTEGSVSVALDKNDGHMINSYLYQNNYAGLIYDRVLKYDNGRIYYAGNSNTSNLIMGIFDTTGRPLKLRSVTPAGGPRSGDVSGGMFYLNYLYYNGLTPRDVILKADSDLNIQFCHEFASDYGISNGMEISKNGNIYIGGNFPSGLPNDYFYYPYVKKLSEKGELGSCSYTSVLPAVTDISPNPVALGYVPLSRSFVPTSISVTFTPDPDGPIITDVLCSSAASCNFIKLSGPDTVCQLNKDYTYWITRNPGCTIVPILSVDTTIAIIRNSNDSSVTISFKKTGGTFLRAILNAGCKLYYDSLFIRVQNSTGFSIGKDTLLCTGDSIVLHAGPYFNSYLWQDGWTDSVYKVKQSGNYSVRVTNACNEVIADTIKVNFVTIPSLQITGNTTICVSDTVSLSASPGFTQYTWTPQPFQTLNNGQQIKFIPVADELVKLRATTAEGCRREDSVNIKVVSARPVFLGKDTSFCAPDSITINAGSGYQQYTWITGSNSNSVIINKTGTYSVVAKDQNGCFAKDTIMVEVFATPKVDLGSDVTLCSGDQRLLDPGSFSKYLWQDGTMNRTYTAKLVGTYWVEVTDQNNCKGSDTIKVVGILPLPTDFLKDADSICEYDKLVIKPTKNFSSYLWSTGSSQAFITVGKPGSYYLTVKDVNGCYGMDTIRVIQKYCLSGVYIPNAFSPNRDGKNDVFTPKVFGKVISYRFIIYDRFGITVFSSADPQSGWNGTYKGVDSPIGAYVWICEYHLEGSDAIKQKGTLILVR